MSAINVGIIGLGRIADVHYPGYRNNKRARIYAVCDINEELAVARKKTWKAVKHYTDYREMLQDPSLDAVEILSPHTLHEPMVLDTAASGKHIALQKPMTVSLESADRMIRAADAGKNIFRVTDNYAFYPPIVLAKKIIESGDIGDPVNLRIKLIGGGSGGWNIPPESWQWRLRESRERGNTLGLETFDHGHHLWTTAWYLMGEAERVSAWIEFMDGIIDAPAVVTWRFKKGYFGSTEFVHLPDLHIPSKYYANDEWIEVSGTKGMILVRRCTGLILDGPPVSVFTNRGWKHYTGVKSDWGEGFRIATGNFINAILGVEKPLLSGPEARDILKFSLAVQKSAHLRREVYLDEMDASFPALTRFRKRRHDMKTEDTGRSLLERLGLSADLSRYAPQARSLTEEFIGKFNKAAAAGWKASIGLHIIAEGGAADTSYSLLINDGELTVKEGETPVSPSLLIHVPAGTWAAILLGKRKIEMAYLQGKLKIEGKAEEALKLRSAFGI
ncbi:MAG: hypothetical protein CVV44_06860 [Spirochaetae bacterium HGW-Spirochaetae-1]|jgi:predicted dehydrogenase/putative sterol carrier protein|nr:MAG: hypothetical protein CVV44_06860 [Spirochaetae bacterium HGW-Spirochaetae-1]